MDQTKRPFRIPPEYSTFAEDHGIFDTYKRLLEKLIINKPDDPLQYMIDELKRENVTVPQIILIGPPASGKHTMGKMLSKKLQCMHITKESLIKDADPSYEEVIESCKNQNETAIVLPDNVLADMLKDRTKSFDCIKKGYVIEGLPETREQALHFQSKGIVTKHCLILEAPDTVLIERIAGKLIDPLSGDVYHVNFDMPTENEVTARLVNPKNYSEEKVIESAIIYRRHINGIIACYKTVAKIFNADQPKSDIFSQAISVLSRKPRTGAPHTPKIILLGPVGSGKKVQASLLANKYKLINVCMGNLIKEAVASGDKTGNACKPYTEKHMLIPDALVLKILQNRLTQMDCQTRGYILHGYPKSRAQAEQLDDAGLSPNRVFIFDIPNDSVLERLTLRSIDPITGDRYHALYNPPRTQNVKDRLQIHPSDTEQNVHSKLSQWQAYADDLNDYYNTKEIVQHINSDQDPQTVFECIESMTTNPLPIKAEDDF